MLDILLLAGSEFEQQVFKLFVDSTKYPVTIHYLKLICELQVGRDECALQWVLLGVVCMRIALQVNLYGFTGPLTSNL